MTKSEKMVKINMPGLYTKGLYYKDKNNIFNKKEIGKKDLKKIDYDNISILIKLYHQGKQFKRTLIYNNLTGLQAIKAAAIQRNIFNETLEKYGELEKKSSFSTLNDIFTVYIENKSGSISERYKYTTIKTYNKWIKNSIGNKNIKNITKYDLQKIVNHVLKEGRAARTALSIKQILRPLYEDAIDAKLVEHNIARNIAIPSFDNTVKFELEDSKRIELYKNILQYEPLKYRGIMLFIYFGRRLNEALTLKWSNINFQKRTYIIEAQYSKIRKTQEYPLLEPLYNFLEDYRDGDISVKDYIFKGKKTKHVTKNTFRHHWKNLLKISGIQAMRAHDTRHLIGNTLVNKGESLENIGKVLGHSSVAVTKRYANTTLSTADRLLNEYLEK